MTMQSDSKVVSGFDPVVETRIITNGRSNASLSPSEYLNRAIANRKNSTKKPTENDRLNLASIQNHKRFSHEAACNRYQTVKNCEQRYQRGVPINRVKHARFQRDLDALERRLEGALPPGLMKGNGGIDRDALTHWLPRNVLNELPIGPDGHLDTCRNTLSRIANQYFELLLDAKDSHKGQFLKHLQVDSDGRHRSWPNPFGTLTGRENPTGRSFAHIPKKYRAMISAVEGRSIVSIDYEQQEPAILASFSNDEKLMEVYANNDLYDYVASRGPWEELSRKQVKTMAISFIYGAHESTISSQLGITHSQAAYYMEELRKLFAEQLQWQERYAHKAYQQKSVRCLDWGMIVTRDAPIRRLKNWPIQAAGADILRRACLGLAEADIQVVGCIHDSIIIEIPEAQSASYIHSTQTIMGDVSEVVLKNMRLKTSVEYFGDDKDA